MIDTKKKLREKITIKGLDVVADTDIFEILDRLEAAEKESDDLRAENAALVDDMNLLRNNNTALRAKIAERCEDAMNECDALRAKIAAMEKQEPGFRERCTPSSPTGYSNRFPLYALPGAKGE